jgi:acyl-coenzyme A thioesterase PaaI-like protein
MLDAVELGMSAELSTTVTEDLTVAHFVAGMPKVYATPMMILLMEMASGAAISPHLPHGHVSVGMEVNVRHLAATPVGRVVRANRCPKARRCRPGRRSAGHSGPTCVRDAAAPSRPAR